MVHSCLALFLLHGNSTDLFEDAVRLIKKYERGTMPAISLMSDTDTDYYKLILLALTYRRVLRIHFCAVT